MFHVDSNQCITAGQLERIVGSSAKLVGFRIQVPKPQYGIANPLVDEAPTAIVTEHRMKSGVTIFNLEWEQSASHHTLSTCPDHIAVKWTSVEDIIQVHSRFHPLTETLTHTPTPTLPSPSLTTPPLSPPPSLQSPSPTTTPPPTTPLPPTTTPPLVRTETTPNTATTLPQTATTPPHTATDLPTKTNMNINTTNTNTNNTTKNTINTVNNINENINTNTNINTNNTISNAISNVDCREKYRHRIAAHRAECFFYRTIAPVLATHGVLLPHAYHADCTDDRFRIFMSCQKEYGVRDPLGDHHLSLVLKDVATMHALFWCAQTRSTDSNVDDRNKQGHRLRGDCVNGKQRRDGDDLGKGKSISIVGDSTSIVGISDLNTVLGRRGCFWTAEKCPSHNAVQLSSTYTGLLTLFGGVQMLSHQLNVSPDQLVSVAASLNLIHKRASESLAQAPSTLLHGDLKLANILWSYQNLTSIATDEARSQPMLIDFEWAGKGPAAQDLAYFLLSSASIECLENNADAKLVEYYHAQLMAKQGTIPYTLNELTHHYEMAVLDIFRWGLLNPFAKISPDSIKSQALCYGRILPNRSLQHFLWLLTKVATILTENEFVIEVLKENN